MADVVYIDNSDGYDDPGATTREIRSGLFAGIPGLFVYGGDTSATLTKLDIYVKRVGSPGDLTINIYESDYDTLLPIGAALYTFTLAEEDAVDGVYDWYSVDLGETVVTDAIEFAITLEGVSTTAPDYWEETDGSMSTGIQWTDGGGVWTVHWTGPAMILYKDDGYTFTPPAGRPTTKRLIAAAASALYYEDV